jgi:hypothetical protein
MDHNILETKQIIKLFLISIVVGTAIVLGAVMPAEYGIDPLGTGKLLGLNKLYIVQETPENAVQESTSVKTVKYPTLSVASAMNNDMVAPKEISNNAPQEQYAERSDLKTITIPAGRGLEYKIKVKKYGQVKYDWNTGGEVLFHDFHGDPIVSEKTNYYQSYTIAYSNNMVGTLIAPFYGKHGWYFKNKTERDITVKLHISGQYELIN